jgi:hypothetical protein
LILVFFSLALPWWAYSTPVQYPALSSPISSLQYPVVSSLQYPAQSQFQTLGSAQNTDRGIEGGMSAAQPLGFNPGGPMLDVGGQPQYLHYNDP